MSHKGFATVTAIFLVLAWFSWKNEKQANAPATTPFTRPNTNAAVTKTSEHVNIDKTLRIVAEKWRTTDVNKDGLYNCIDAAVLFYKYYPDKSKVCIEINVNPKTDMNHLFNCVFTDGVWKAVEPQSYYCNRSNYWMGAFWGNQYDKIHNRDETQKWKVYAK